MIEQFLRYLEFEKRYSQHTLTAYKDDLTSLSNFVSHTFEIKDHSEIKHTHLRSWLVELSESGLSARTINRKIASLKSYFKFLQSREYIAKNPASRLKVLKTEKKLPSFVKEDEINRLLDQVEFSNDFEGNRDKLLIELFYSTGMRLSELINLKISDVNIYESTVKVLGKRNKERLIPIGDNLVKYIRSYMEIRKQEQLGNSCPNLLITVNGDPMYPMLVYRTIKKNLSLVTTLSKKSPHVLRHTFATHLLDKGADLNAVKDLLGHTSLAATQVYTHNSLEKLKSTFDQAHPKA